jgi:acyl CoA:acetate/3-ketoacid CoA transferase alpha subunit/acyl CoA:acetate/3-ketoacid CoA transferase beta subunit
MLSDVFRLEPYEKINKVVDLKTAIATYVQEGMALYLTRSAEAAACEIIRQFWDRRPAFTLMMVLPGGAQAMCLIHRGLLKKLIFTTCADLYPSPSPNPIIQRAYRQKAVEFENWSVLSLTQALMAGALNLPFMPTLSISGSDMAIENSRAFTEIDDPFEGGKIGVVKRMNPDVALYHGWAADGAGNTILAPYGDDREWGAKASRKGVVVTVERIVSTEFIREHANLVKIPGYMVDAVCLAPFGAHPRAMNNRGLPEFDAYDVDVPFLMEFRDAGKKPESLDQWIQAWILNCDHEERLKKLGPERIYRLKGKAAKENWPIRLTQVKDEAVKPKAYNEIEFAIVAASRKIQGIFLKGGFKAIFAGIGLGGLAGWLAYYALKEKGQEIYMVGAGIGFDPRPADPLMSSSGNIATSRMLTDSVDIHGVCIGGVRKACLGILGAAQIDKFGNLNSSKISSTTYIGGAGGGNDIANGAREVVVITKQKKDRFLEQVSYITCVGTKVMTLISNLGIFEKNGPEFELTTYFAPDESTKEQMINKITDHCGWEIKVSKQVQAASEPTKNQLALLRSLDPEGVFIT